MAISSAGIAVAIVVGALLLGFSFGDSQAGAPVLAVAVGLGAFGVLYRSTLVGLVSAATLIAAIVLVVVNTNRAEQIAYLSIGIVSCAAAIGALLMMRPEPHQE